MANFPVVADLVVDMTSFIDRFPSPHPATRGSESPAAGGSAPSGIDGYERFEDCIECGLCLSACPVAATDDSYVGPAALAYAQRMLEEPRGANTAPILEWADADNAAWRCHAAFECTEACPSNVRPAQRIMQLRRDPQAVQPVEQQPEDQEHVEPEEQGERGDLEEAVPGALAAEEQ